MPGCGCGCGAGTSRVGLCTSAGNKAMDTPVVLRAGERLLAARRAPGPPRGASLRRDVQLFAALDATGKGACSTDQQAALDAALSFIRSHYGDLGWGPADCVPNGPDSSCEEGMPDPTACWGGVPFIFPPGLNPLEESALQVLFRAPALRIRDTLERPDLELVIHCRNRFWVEDGTRWCRTVNKLTPAFTPCRDFTNTKKHINICEWYLNRVVDCEQTPEQLAVIVVHEMFHAWGANEAAARAMHRATGWVEPTF